MVRRIALVLILLAGVFWLASTFVLDYPGKTRGVDNLTDSFRSVFTDAGIQQAQADIATIDAFAAEFQSKAVPALATQLNMTPEQLVTALSAQYTDVGAGIQQLPTSLPYFDGLVSGLAAQQSNFQQADDIPMSSLPAATVHWLFIILGAVAIILALAGLLRPSRARLVLGVSAFVGLAVIAVSLVLSVPSKAQAVDSMTDAFRPVFTTEGAAQTRAYLTNFQAMGTQLTGEALPGLATMLDVTPGKLSDSLGQGFPAVAAGLQQLPQILPRFDALVTKIEDNVGNFQLADSIPTTDTATTALEAQLVFPAAVLLLAGLVGLLVPMARKDRVLTKP